MISESSMKAAKHSRNAHPYAEVETYNPLTETYESEYRFTVLPPGPHAPNKFEAKALRRICSQTGLTPEQVREHKKYRQELAQAANGHVKERGFRSFNEKFYVKSAKRLRKEISTKRGLSPFNPLFFRFFEMQWQNLHGKDAMNAQLAFSLSLKK